MGVARTGYLVGSRVPTKMWMMGRPVKPHEAALTQLAITCGEPPCGHPCGQRLDRCEN
jgi:hypothetical protein